MKGATTFAGTIDSKGKLHLDPRDRMAFDRMSRLLCGKRVELQMRKFRKKRTLPQNAFYFGVLVPTLAEHIGLDVDEMHEQLKRHFLSERIDENFARVKSTTELSTEEFSRYMEDCQRLAAEYGVDVPMPNEVAA